jgi:hypothetical protein
MDDDIATGKQFFRQKKIFKFSSSIGCSKIYSGSLPTTIVLDKYGIMRLHHEGFANYDGEEFNLQIKQLLEE